MMDANALSGRGSGALLEEAKGMQVQEVGPLPVVVGQMVHLAVGGKRHYFFIQNSAG